jgi:isopenicillin N synthase-like dioxygenase/tRNA(Arg) A34 adenosine deaminase TadA
MPSPFRERKLPNQSKEEAEQNGTTFGVVWICSYNTIIVLGLEASVVKQQDHMATYKAPAETSLSDIDATCMRAAIEESLHAVQTGHMPFGGVVADANGTILVRGHNLCKAGPTRGGGANSDPTQHAEMEVVRLACTKIDATLRPSCTLYTSTEPCVMCAGAIYWSRIGRIVYGCSSEELASYTGPGGFDIPIDTIYTLGRPGTRQLEVHGPYLSEEAMKVHIESGVWGTAAPPQTNENEEDKKEDDHFDSVALKDIAVEASLFTSGLGAAASSNDLVVPIIDMSVGTNDEIAQALWDAATTVGFFTLINHGIPSELVDLAFETSAQFFAQTQEEKEEQSPYARNLNSGYEYMKQLRPSTGTIDQKESIQITAREGSMEGRWPSTPTQFRTVTETFLNQVHALAGRILDLLEPRATPNVDPGTLSSSHTLGGSDGQCTLRMLHYPPMDVDTLRKLTTPDEQGRISWRAGPHTDWSNLTLLFQRVGQAGLECCSNPTDSSKERRWTPIDPVENGIAVNIGDMLSRWSHHRLYSNLHRVRMPTEMECTPPSSRYSIAFFAQSDQSTVIQSTSSEDPPITAGDYLLSRIKSNFTNDAT